MWRLAGYRVLIVAASRPGGLLPGRDGAQSPLAALADEVQRSFGDALVDLDRADGRRFVDALLDAGPNGLGEPFRQALFRQTGGNPLFVLDLLDALRENRSLARDRTGRWVEGESVDLEVLPPRVAAVAAGRVGGLPPDLRATLAAACVEGETFTAEVVARALGVDEGVLVHRLSEYLGRQRRLVAACGVQRVDGAADPARGALRLSRYRFRHQLVRRYLYGSLDEVERSRLHEAVARALRDVYEGCEERVAARLARHLEAAGLAV